MVYKEPPQMKRANDLRAKMKRQNTSMNYMMKRSARKMNFAMNKHAKRWLILLAMICLHLEETLRSLKIMQKIADDPKNKDLFGHWIEGHDTAASRATNPNAGTWQVYGLDPIVAAEMKMSARGNQLALKVLYKIRLTLQKTKRLRLPN